MQRFFSDLQDLFYQEGWGRQYFISALSERLFIYNDGRVLGMILWCQELPFTLELTISGTPNKTAIYSLEDSTMKEIAQRMITTFETEKESS